MKVIENKHLQKIADEIGISVECSKKAIISEHFRKQWPNQKMEIIRLELDIKILNKLNKIAKALKVSLDAVIEGILRTEIERRMSLTKMKKGSFIINEGRVTSAIIPIKEYELLGLKKQPNKNTRNKNAKTKQK